MSSPFQSSLNPDNKYTNPFAPMKSSQTNVNLAGVDYTTSKYHDISGKTTSSPLHIADLLNYQKTEPSSATHDYSKLINNKDTFLHNSGLGLGSVQVSTTAGYSGASQDLSKGIASQMASINYQPSTLSYQLLSQNKPEDKPLVTFESDYVNYSSSLDSAQLKKDNTYQTNVLNENTANLLKLMPGHTAHIKSFDETTKQTGNNQEYKTYDLGATSYSSDMKNYGLSQTEYKPLLLTQPAINTTLGNVPVSYGFNVDTAPKLTNYANLAPNLYQSNTINTQGMPNFGQQDYQGLGGNSLFAKDNHLSKSVYGQTSRESQVPLERTTVGDNTLNSQIRTEKKKVLQESSSNPYLSTLSTGSYLNTLQTPADSKKKDRYEPKVSDMTSPPMKHDQLEKVESDYMMFEPIVSKKTIYTIENNNAIKVKSNKESIVDLATIRTPERRMKPRSENQSPLDDLRYSLKNEGVQISKIIIETVENCTADEVYHDIQNTREDGPLNIVMEHKTPVKSDYRSSIVQLSPPIERPPIVQLSPAIERPPIVQLSPPIERPQQRFNEEDSFKGPATYRKELNELRSEIARFSHTLHTETPVLGHSRQRSNQSSTNNLTGYEKFYSLEREQFNTEQRKSLYRDEEKENDKDCTSSGTEERLYTFEKLDQAHAREENKNARRYNEKVEDNLEIPNIHHHHHHHHHHSHSNSPRNQDNLHKFGQGGFSPQLVHEEFHDLHDHEHGHGHEHEQEHDHDHEHHHHHHQEKQEIDPKRELIDHHEHHAHHEEHHHHKEEQVKQPEKKKEDVKHKKENETLRKVAKKPQNLLVKGIIGLIVIILISLLGLELLTDINFDEYFENLNL